LAELLGYDAELALLRGTDVRLDMRFAAHSWW